VTTNARGLIETYTSWLREGSSEREIEAGWNALTLPFLDHHNDHLRVYVKRVGDWFLITDDSQTMNQLRGGPEERSRYKVLARQTLIGLGLDPGLPDSDEIIAMAEAADFPRKLHGVLLAMLAIDGAIAALGPQGGPTT
jgi:hypothetical protein